MNKLITLILSYFVPKELRDEDCPIEGAEMQRQADQILAGTRTQADIFKEHDK